MKKDLPALLAALPFLTLPMTVPQTAPAADAGTDAQKSPTAQHQGGHRSAPPGKVFDKVAAVIDQTPILLSELDLEARVTLIRQGGVRAAVVADLGLDVLKEMLGHVINQRLGEREANRLQTVRISAESQLEAYEEFVRQIGGEAAFQDFLQAHEASAQRVMTILERDLKVTQFLADKISMSARISEADARDFYDADPQRFGTRPFEDVRSAIIAMLTRDKVKELSAQFFEELKERAEIRVLPPFADVAEEHRPTERHGPPPMVRIEIPARTDAEDAGAKD